MRFVVVTGTGTGVGKTVTTAALVCAAEADGAQVSVVKPYQTGVSGDDPSDAATVMALSGCTDVHELVRLDDALAPESAARLRGVGTPLVEDLVDDVAERGAGRDLTLVEGAGGVAVRLDPAGGTIATLAAALRARGHRVDVVVVTTLGLGTLNHTELTVQALRSQELEPFGMALGCVPEALGLAERCNVEDLPRLTGVPVVARIPAGAGAMNAADFRAAAPTWIEWRRVAY
jgi:dethiobiotin synthetase